MSAFAFMSAASLARAQTAAPPMDCAAINAMDHSQMDHAAHQSAVAACNAQRLPTQSGQAAFAAIAEVVRLLEADSTTDWSRVNIEALRQHLIDMDDVTMRSAVTQRNVAGGIEVDASGSGRTVTSIRHLLKSHVATLDRGGIYRAGFREIPDGARITVTALDSSNQGTVARIRGLGFAGLITEGSHHAPHHMALARGDTDPHGH